MKGALSHQVEVSLPADYVWDVFRSLQLADLVVKLLPHVVAKVDVEEGDGGVGTVLSLTLPPGTPGFQTYKEKFVKIDDKERVKEAVVVEGGYLTLGFQSYLVRFAVIEKGCDSSAIISTIEYEINDEGAEKASYVTIGPVADLTETISKYLVEKKYDNDKV